MVLAVLAWASPAAGQASRNRAATEIGGVSATAVTTSEVDACARADGEPDHEPTPEEQAQMGRAFDEHYSRGAVLYTQGNYEAAIDELAAAYCHIPLPAVLIDIAQAFERMLLYEKTVAYLERYILEAPESEAARRERISYRVEVLRAVPARIRVATIPPGATVTILGPGGTVVANPIANDPESTPVQKGSYEMRVELAGYQPVVENIVLRIGQAESYTYQLHPLQGQIRITTSPKDARIFVDKRLVGIGSYVARIPIGAHELTVEAGGRPPITRAFEVTAGKSTDLPIELPRKPRSGRRELLTASTLFGGIFGTSAVVSLLGAEEGGGSIGFVTGLGLGFGGAFLGIPDDISVGTSSYIIGSTAIAAAEGGIIASIFACDEDPPSAADPDGNTDCDTDALTGVALASSVVGAVAAAATAPKLDLSAGDAALINSGEMWGAATGVMFWLVFDENETARVPLWLAGLNLGILAGGTLAAKSEVSRGHVALIDLAGLAGVITGVAASSVIEESGQSERTFHFALIGMTTGLIAGTYLTRNMDEPKAKPLQQLTPTVSTMRDSAGRDTLTLGAALTF